MTQDWWRVELLFLFHKHSLQTDYAQMRSRIYQGLGYIIIFYTRTTLNTDFLKTLLALFTCRCMGGSNINEDLSKQLLIQKALENAACKADVLFISNSRWYIATSQPSLYSLHVSIQISSLNSFNRKLIGPCGQ